MTPWSVLRILRVCLSGKAMKPKGFWSYARGDDDHLDEVLTSLREKIEGEISMLLGHDVDIFQDIEDLRAGDLWAETLKGSLTQATFFIPVLTPRFFNRSWCRDETLTFLREAEAQGVVPLVFPIRFVEYDADEDCEVRAALSTFQHMDFRNWRFESDPTKRARLLNDFGRDVKSKLKLPPKPAPKAAAKPAKSSEPTKEIAEAQETFKPAPKPVVQELVVDPWPGRGDFDTIDAAIKAAEPGARILIREGTYTENLVLDKPLELIGEGAADAVLVGVDKDHAMKVTAPMGLVRNMRFLRGEGEGNKVAVWVTAGRCQFEDCSFTSHALSAVAVEGLGTAPQFLRCRFLGSKEAGAHVFDQATPRFDDCVLRDNGLHGLAVQERADPVVQRCVMSDNMYNGLHCYECGRGQFGDCEMSTNGTYGVQIKKEADPDLQGCLLKENRQTGVFCYEDGRGRFTDCEMASNGFDGVATAEGGALRLRACRLLDNHAWGFVAVDAYGGGTVENCEFRGNNRGAWHFANGSEGNVIRRNNIEE